VKIAQLKETNEDLQYRVMANLRKELRVRINELYKVNYINNFILEKIENLDSARSHSNSEQEINLTKKN
jgi:hypothetical protein